MNAIRIGIDDAIRIKSEIYNQMKIEYAKLVELKSEFINLENDYIQERYIAMKNLEDQKFARKDDQDAAIYQTMDKQIYTSYHKMKSEIEIVELEIEKLRNEGKQISDVIVALGIREKNKAALSR
jgi:hypothetical protein